MELHDGGGYPGGPPCKRYVLATNPLDGCSARLRFDLVDGAVVLDPEIVQTLPAPRPWRDLPSQRSLQHLRVSSVLKDVREYTAELQDADRIEVLRRGE